MICKDHVVTTDIISIYVTSTICCQNLGLYTYTEIGGRVAIQHDTTVTTNMM